MLLICQNIVLVSLFFEIMPWSFTQRKNQRANTVWAGGTIFGLILCPALNIQLTFLLPIQFNPTQKLKRNKKDFAFTINCGKGQHWRRLQHLKFVLRITIFCKLAYRMNIFLPNIAPDFILQISLLDEYFCKLLNLMLFCKLLHPRIFFVKAHYWEPKKLLRGSICVW